MIPHLGHVFTALSLVKSKGTRVLTSSPGLMVRTANMVLLLHYTYNVASHQFATRLLSPVCFLGKPLDDFLTHVEVEGKPFVFDELACKDSGRWFVCQFRP